MKGIRGKVLTLTAPGWLAIALMDATGVAHAALLSRAGGEAYYDTSLNITWLADANFAASNPFGITTIDMNDPVGTTGIRPDGTMTWTTAKNWTTAMNAANYLGVNTWRLPNVNAAQYAGACRGGYTGGDCGFNVDLSTGEMARMYYETLGNSAAWNTSGVVQPCVSAGPTDCLVNTGPFANLMPGYYWYRTPYYDVGAWQFDFAWGRQDYIYSGNAHHAWPVAPGDPFNAVPVPAGVWLFPSALAALGWVRRKRHADKR